MDERRRDINRVLKGVRQQLNYLREDLESGPTPKWVDSDGRTAAEHWASWGLVTTRDIQLELRVLERVDLRPLLRAAEVIECNSHQQEVARAHATFTAAGGFMLVGDLPEP